MHKINLVWHCGLVGSACTWDGKGCEFDSWQCQIYIPCSLSLRLLGSFRGSLGTYLWLATKILLKKVTYMVWIILYIFNSSFGVWQCPIVKFIKCVSVLEVESILFWLSEQRVNLNSLNIPDQPYQVGRHASFVIIFKLKICWSEVFMLRCLKMLRSYW